MNQRLGYARISADDQNLNLQREALRRAGVLSIYEEVTNDKRAVRPQLERCLKALGANDTLVVWRLDRLGRNAAELIRIVAALGQRSIGVESLTEALKIGGDAGKPASQVFAALAEFDRYLTQERTRSGLMAARARGRAGGRKPKLNEQQVEEVKRLMADPTIPIGQIAARYKVSRTTLYKVASLAPVPAVETPPEVVAMMTSMQDAL
jgi:DNA invertase Pin-like site-specific DNA recombinase